ncbi:MAG: hypothetical protein N2316_11500 [Spirochaetes bacterium]|nr:hypothetical protein [Spirochaetota bacterium]
MKASIFALILLQIEICAFAGSLLINEIAPATSGDDWVELFFHGQCGEYLNISQFYVTMYYGSNEKLSENPITLYACDRPQTPYDDRFAVVHLTSPGIPDETDLTGDTNQNGFIDIYCNNYTGSLWNTDCIVAIDTDNDITNGGIIDFVAYSNRDGTPNSTIINYLSYAQKENQWESYEGENPQLSMIDIGLSGLSAHQTIARLNEYDSNRKEDFTITNFQTPGRQNKISTIPSTHRLFEITKKQITILPGHSIYGTCQIPIFVFHPISIRYRIFTPIGTLVFESSLQDVATPGTHVLSWNLIGARQTAGTGLYIACIEATNSILRRFQRENVYIIITRYQ